MLAVGGKAEHIIPVCSSHQRTTEEGQELSGSKMAEGDQIPSIYDSSGLGMFCGVFGPLQVKANLPLQTIRSIEAMLLSPPVH